MSRREWRRLVGKMKARADAAKATSDAKEGRSPNWSLFELWELLIFRDILKKHETGLDLTSDERDLFVRLERKAGVPEEPIAD